MEGGKRQREGEESNTLKKGMGWRRKQGRKMDCKREKNAERNRGGMKKSEGSNG